MAFKSFVFLFLALLLFTTGSSIKAPAHAPEKPPVAAHPPEKAPTPIAVHPPVKAPIAVPPPVKAPVYECWTACEEHCKDHRRKRPCMRVCTKCCKKCNKCVPLGNWKCPGWDFVFIHGQRVACP